MTKVISTNVNTAQEYQDALEKVYLNPPGSLTTTQLIASTVVYPADTVITSTGYVVPGLGPGPWMQTGGTGQTPNQTPSQKVGARYTDGNGNEWALINNGTIRISQLGGLIGSNNGAVVFAFNASSADTLDLEGLTWPARDVDSDNASDKAKLQKSFVNGTLIVSNSFDNDVDLQTIQPFSQDEIAVSGKKSQVLTWKDKRVLWLGTSIPHQGAGSDGYPELLSSTLDFTVANWAWSGSHAFYNIAGNAFDSGTVRALSMTEADRLAGLALYGSASAYDDSFNNVTLASEMTAEYRIKNQFIANAYDVVVLDHNHNDRKSVQTYTVNDKTLTAITKGATTVVAVNNTTGLTVGDGVYLQVTGIVNLQYAAARITAISSLNITLAIDSSSYAGTFSAGTFHWVDRNTLEGSFDFLIAYTKNMGIIYGNSDVEIVLCNAPSYFTNDTDRDFSIWNSGKTIKSIADKWSLGYFDVAAALNLIYSQHLIYFPDEVHPSTLETRKALASYWASWMSGGEQTVTNAADSLAKNKHVSDAHQELALFSKYDDAYAYRANLFTDDTPIINEDFSSGIGSWTVTSTPPVIEAAPWGAGDAAKFSVTAGTPQPYISKLSASGFDPILKFDLYFPVISLATGTSNQLTVFSLLTSDATAYNVTIVQSAGGDATLRVTRSDGNVSAANTRSYVISAAVRYTIVVDIIKGNTTSDNGYVFITVNGVKLYSGEFANGGVSAITATRLGAVFNNMASSFSLFISNIETGGKTRRSSTSYGTLGTAATKDTGTGGAQLPTTAEADARYLLESNNLSDLPIPSIARTNLGLGTAATKVVTTSSTDTTADRLTKVGDFGIGGDGGVIAGDNANNIVEGGIYRATSSTANLGFTGTSSVIVSRSFNVVSQIQTDGNKFLSRRSTDTGSTWSSWSEFYNSVNSVNPLDYGIGTTTLTQLSNQNIDNVSDTGFYTGYGPNNGNASTGDHPFPGFAGAYSLSVYKGVNDSAGDYVVQEATKFDTSVVEKKIRTSSTSTWSDWAVVYTSDNSVNPLDFGLKEAVTLSASDDLNTLLETKFWFNPTGTYAPGNNYPIAAAGSLFVLARTPTNVTQEYVKYAEGLISRKWFRSKGAAGWSNWHEIFHSGNTNFDVFTVGNARNLKAHGVALNGITIRFDLPLNSKVLPANVSNVGSFKIVKNSTGATLATGLSATMASESTQKNLCADFIVPAGAVAGDSYRAVAESNSSITVTY
jgi:hypothetical protein